MASASELMSTGIPAAAAKSLGQILQDTVTAAGSTQATATAVTGSFVIVSTAAASTGIVLPSAVGQPAIVVYNGGANTVAVYPALGEKINAGSANAGFNVATTKSCTFVPNGAQWIANLSA